MVEPQLCRMALIVSAGAALVTASAGCWQYILSSSCWRRILSLRQEALRLSQARLGATAEVCATVRVVKLRTLLPI
eukprot:3702628-Rhodomonas_salina.1